MRVRCYSLPPLWGEGLCPIERPVDGRRTNQGFLIVRLLLLLERRRDVR